jgi:hypothetical protein
MRLFDGMASRTERPRPIAGYPKCPLAQRDTSEISDSDVVSILTNSKQ